MTKPDILLMGPPAHPDIPAELERDFRLHRYWEAADPRALVASLSDGLRYISTTGHDGPDAGLIRALPKLELISSFGVGYDGIDVAAAAAQGVQVTNTPDVLNDCVAELTLALMLALAREVIASDRFVREGRWAEGRYPFTGELTGKRAGILGLGRIGKEIARRLEVFKMEIAYHGRREQEGVPYRYYGDLREMAREADWLIVIAPATAESRHLVDAAVLDALGPEGHLINVARGAGWSPRRWQSDANCARAGSGPGWSRARPASRPVPTCWRAGPNARSRAARGSASTSPITTARPISRSSSAYPPSRRAKPKRCASCRRWASIRSCASRRSRPRPRRSTSSPRRNCRTTTWRRR
ncbi:NAD(P)-dependent oxidoreductase [Mangrovicoccus ximenensis]|uniref:NAD(P)-dependent oxidoreductase n=1 Tax=Mangrovicoccus ximenensis TaxID=1911570 RepID=UPI000D3414FE|nr:NAD(P)-dependent oxidoreductase [Mangrovicoccus ximenensis]